MAIAEVAEYAHLSDADIEALAAELEAIRLDIEDSRGAKRQCLRPAHHRCSTPPCERPVAAAAFRWRRITSMLRSVDFSRTTGMWLASANEATERRNPSPICCRHAGDGTGKPRCRKNCTT